MIAFFSALCQEATICYIRVMNNKIVEKYFHQGKGFGEQVEQIQKEVCARAGIKPLEELFRGRIYDRDKVHNVVFRGEQSGRLVVVKIQGMKLENEESELKDSLFQSRNGRLCGFL